MRLSQETLALDVFGDGKRKSDISRIERNESTPQEHTVQRLIKALSITEGDMAPIRAGRSTDQQLEALPTLSRAELVNLAYRFQIADADDQPDHALRAELTNRAEEYRALKRELEAVRTSIPRLDNVITEALALLDQGSAGAKDVRAMIAEARKSWHQSVLRDALEQDAQLAEVQARAALMEGDAEGAFALLSAAADTFAGIDPLEPARRRVGYEDLLYNHGLRFGGAGLALAERMNRDALGGLPQGADPVLWAGLHNSLGNALQNQGSRTEGATGTDFLAQAVVAYDAALTVVTKDGHQVRWAMTMQNKANALEIQGSRTEGVAGTELLAQAVAGYDAALTVFTKVAYPVEWATTMQNKAIALQTQGTRTEGAAGTDLLARAVAGYDDALTVRTKDAHPVDWAMTMHNKAGALATQGMRTEGVAGLGLLAEARRAYLASLEVRTRADRPADWAMTQVNLGRLEWHTAGHPACTDPVAHLRAGLGHVGLALEVYDPVHMSHDHQKATKLRNYILSALAALPQP